ncbi:MAG TPA: YgdI/YgdR family lipoprotein [Terriglobales bacterium]|nr:YgdI/YgdR family lipoprotein [Terriglobales bacterium]
MKARLLLAACLLALTACSSHYIITTADGQMITTDNKPRVDKDSGMVRFEDSEGKEQMIPQTQIRQIIER